MDKNQEFENEVFMNIAGLSADEQLKKQSLEWNFASARHRYTYNFRYLGRPIIQFPQDIMAMQEVIWKVKPDLIIETGIAHGGSLMLSARPLKKAKIPLVIKFGQIFQKKTEDENQTYHCWLSN